jgi:hypothetical protein
MDTTLIVGKIDVHWRTRSRELICFRGRVRPNGPSSGLLPGLTTSVPRVLTSSKEDVDMIIHTEISGHGSCEISCATTLGALRVHFEIARTKRGLPKHHANFHGKRLEHPDITFERLSFIPVA